LRPRPPLTAPEPKSGQVEGLDRRSGSPQWSFTKEVRYALASYSFGVARSKTAVEPFGRIWRTPARSHADPRRERTPNVTQKPCEYWHETRSARHGRVR